MEPNRMVRLESGSQTSYFVRLGALRSLDDVEFHFVTFLERLIAVELNRGVVHKDVGTTIPTQKPETFCAIEPLDLSFVLRHWEVLLSLRL